MPWCPLFGCSCCRYAVSRVITAVTKRLMQLTVADFDWSMVQAVYELPALFSGMELFGYVFCLAKQKLETELGDLELVWTNSSGESCALSKQQKLLGLPYQAIYDLL